MWSFSRCARLHQKVQCSQCLPHWNQGIAYFICGQCLIDSDSSRKFNKLRLDALSIPNYVRTKDPIMVLDKSRPKNKWSTTLFGRCARDVVRKLTLKVNIFTGFHDRFLRQFNVIKIRNRMCKEWDELAQKTIHIVLLQRKKKPHGQWFLILNEAGKNEPMNLRCD